MNIKQSSIYKLVEPLLPVRSTNKRLETGRLIFTNDEMLILKKYISGRKIDPRQRSSVEELAQEGYIDICEDYTRTSSFDDNLEYFF